MLSLPRRIIYLCLWSGSALWYQFACCFISAGAVSSCLKNSHLFLHSSRPRRTLAIWKKGVVFAGDKRVERVGACDGPSQEAVQTSTWSTWHVDATALSFWWSCAQQNICNRITGSKTDARCREDLIYPDGFNSTFNDRLVFLIQTLNLAFTLLFGWLFGFCGADKLTESKRPKRWF